MNGLRQQLEAKRAELVRCEAVAADPEAEPAEVAAASAAIPHLKQNIGALEGALIWGEEALAKIEAGFALLAKSASSRELSLSITCFETGIWRLRNHLGSKAE